MEAAENRGLGDRIATEGGTFSDDEIKSLLDSSMKFILASRLVNAGDKRSYMRALKEVEWG